MVHSLDAEKFERDFVVPIIEQFLVSPENGHRTQDHHSIRAIRHFYSMTPNNEDVAAALDVRHEMRRNSDDRHIPSQLSNLLVKDIENFISLHRKMSDAMSEREKGRSQLFGDVPENE